MSGHFLTPEEQAEEQRRQADTARRKWQDGEARRFWQRNLADPAGRAEIWRILQELDAFRTVFRFSPNGATDERATWFHTGRSTYGFEMYQHLLSIAPEAVLEMQREHDPRFAPADDEPKADRG